MLGGLFLNSSRFLLNALPNYVQYAVIALLILIFFLLLRKIFTTYVFNLLRRLFSKTNYLNEDFLLAFEGPVRLFFIILGIYIALLYLPLNKDWHLLGTKIFRSLIIVLITWGLYNLEGVNSPFFSKLQEKFNTQVDTILFSFLSKSLRIITILFAFTIIVQEWDYDINGLIAGFGLGGLAFAMAAKDALANIFGGMVIILDKPFSIGDWIKTPSVEGTVEDISFRSTRVRTFAQALVTVPNSTLANESITNWSKMGKRQISFHLGVTHTTPRDKLEQCVSEIRTMLENHPNIHKETILVRFQDFSENSLDIFCYFFTITTVWSEFLKVREDINFKILEILEKDNISLAFPSRSIYLETPSPRTPKQ